MVHLKSDREARGSRGSRGFSRYPKPGDFK